MIKCIIFDMDGVLINTEPVHFAIWKQICAEHGVTVSYDCYKECIGSTMAFLYDLTEKQYGLSLDSDPTIPQRYAELKAEQFAKHGVPKIKGAAEAVRTLYEKGYVLGVASSSAQKYIDYSMKEIGIDRYFHRMISGENVVHPKPAPDVFLEAARQLGYDPSDCLVIEDSRNGSLAAKAAGMTCLGFVNPDSGNQDLSAADAVFHDYAELADHPLLR